MPPPDHGLGQSLANVFARTSRKETPASGIAEIDIGLIRPPAANPRRSFDEGALEDLASSIREHGLLQPIVVMRQAQGGGYEVVAGERRWRAAKMVGLAKVPVVIREGDDPRHIAEIRLVENIQRENLNPVELAQAYRALMDEHHLTQEELAGRLGKDRSSIANTLRLLQLPKGVLDAVAGGTLSTGHAKALLSLAEPTAQRELAQKVVDEGWSVRETERQVRLWGRSTRGPGKTQPSHIRELEHNLFRLLGAPVKVREAGGKGTITVSFASKAGFQRVVEVFDRVCKEAAKRGEEG